VLVLPGGFHLVHQRPSARATGNGEITLFPAVYYEIWASASMRADEVTG
jgi:hypothetical protein